MATKNNGDAKYLPDGSFDWSGGVDSSLVTTLQSTLNPHGLARNQLAWLYNGTVRGGGILQRTGWQPLLRLLSSGRWQGGFPYEPDSANPYLVCSVDGHIYQALLEAPYTITDLSNVFGLFNPPTAEIAFFAQGESYLVIQAGDYATGPFNITINSYGTPLVSPSSTLPLFWDGTTLRRSRGITTIVPTMTPDVNEIPAATDMWYHGGMMWYAQARQVSAGDMVGGPSGNVANHSRDSILSVTENPLCVGGDGFSIPTNAGNIRALRDENNINQSVAGSRLLIWTRKSVFALSIPTTRTDWINASATNQPLMVPVQKVNGTTGERSVVACNGDWFYQSLEPSIRSLITAVRQYNQWGNTPISQNEQRALQASDRSLMRFSGGIQFDNRMLQLVMPRLAADGVNVVHDAILPLDFDIVSNLNTADQAEAMTAPVWEGAYSGLPFLELFEGDFGGLHRAFGAVISEVDGSIDIWELTTSNRRENGDGRVTWGAEFPAFTWQTAGLEFKLKHLKGGELWLDKVYGTVDIDVWYREDADPCWRKWLHTSVCAGRDCTETDPVCVYPTGTPFREGYKFPIVFPEPKPACDSMGVRTSTIGYQFQVKILLTGWARIRGFIPYALAHTEPQYHGIACAPEMGVLSGGINTTGMTKLPIGRFTLPSPFPPQPAPGTITGAGGDTPSGAGGDDITGAGG